MIFSGWITRNFKINIVDISIQNNQLFFLNTSLFETNVVSMMYTK